MQALALLPGVVVVRPSPELRHRQEHSRIWNETWLSAFFHKPCNHELFVHQSLNMEGTCNSQPRAAGPLHGCRTPLLSHTQALREEGAEGRPHISVHQWMSPPSLSVKVIGNSPARANSWQERKSYNGLNPTSAQ